ncbi:hypothetical protein O8C80_11375 [Aliarcobacter butzleri]|uniref:hypothetical protein n=1 Tax=Aliarcobacter butzleri TaxID=28197 RepID=UPI00263D19B3|nr:hypothetical protein [Aliarcobacter butzleri]MDN5043925.1 hypothetical protein [Aliarcobacter butzleri]
MEISSVSNLYQTQEVKKDSQKEYDNYSTFAEILAANSTQSIYQTQQTNSVNTNPYNKEETQKDYSSYNTFKELREIPYEEAKANYDSILKRIEELQAKELAENTFEGTKGMASTSTRIQVGTAIYSDNDKLNKALYETTQAIKDDVEAFVTTSEIYENMRNYYHGYDTKASFVIDERTYGKEIPDLTRAQINSINVEDFLSKMTSTFTKDYEEAPSYVKNQYKAIVDGYSLFQQSYNQSKKEPFYA